jgi:hypothetical protein
MGVLDRRRAPRRPPPSIPQGRGAGEAGARTDEYSDALLERPAGARVGPKVLRPAVLAACLLAGAAGAQTPSPLVREYQIKAAFLYNFAKFTDWPSEVLPETSDTLTLCLFADDPVSEALESIKGKTVKGRRLTIRRIEPGTDLDSCHVLFIGSAEEKRSLQLLQRLQGSSVLTVGEIEHFAEAGGIINFFVERNKVRFEINVSSAEKARLKLSSQLLGLARVVRQ